MHVYPIDAKTKDGNLFWTLPKRPPVPVDFDPNNLLHCQFVSSLACLKAKMFQIEIPSKAPRSDAWRKEIGAYAAQAKVPDFVPDDEKAKEIHAQVNKEVKEEEKTEEDSKVEEEPKMDQNDVEFLQKEFEQLVKKFDERVEGKVKLEKIIQPEEFEKDND